MRRAIVLLLGLTLITGGILGASLTWTGSGGVRAQDASSGTQPSQMHAWMHGMMDQMMGAGAAERMHAMMPGSEAMMEACAGGMGGIMSGAVPGMPMDGTGYGSE